jgi:hypothetical protein
VKGSDHVTARPGALTGDRIDTSQRSSRFYNTQTLAAIFAAMFAPLDVPLGEIADPLPA